MQLSKVAALSRLGATRINRELVRVNCVRALTAALMRTGLELPPAPPLERHTFTELVGSWSIGGAERWIEAVLKKPKKPQHEGRRPMLDSIIEIAKHAPTSMSKNGIRKSLSDQNSNGPWAKAKLSLSRASLRNPKMGQILYRAYRVAPDPDWQPPARVTKAEVPNQTAAMSKLLELAEETRTNNPQFTKEQAFRKVLDRSEGSKLYREDRNERLGIAGA